MEFLKNLFSPKGGENPRWKEVYRPREVFAIGDLHGNFEALKGNLGFLNLVDISGDTLTWKGGDAHVVMLGDILGDRKPEGKKILQTLLKLKKEAKEQSGDIEVLAGNHDNAFFAFLFGYRISANSPDPTTYLLGNPQFQGVQELFPSGIQDLILRKTLGELGSRTSPVNHDESKVENFALFPINREPSEREIYFLENKNIFDELGGRKGIRNIIHINPIEKDLYREMFSLYSLVTRRDDTLFLHCDPVPALLEHLIAHAEFKGNDLDSAITSINIFFSSELLALLENPDVEPNKDFIKLTLTYLDTNNRDAIPLLESQEQKLLLEKLRKLGITTIVHGHSTATPTTYIAKPHGLIDIVRTDFGAYQPKVRIGEESKRSVVSISSSRGNHPGEIFSGLDRKNPLRK